MTQLNRDNRGLSLVELIVALLILTVIFAPTFTSFSVSLKMTTEAKNQFNGATVADNIMEVLKYEMSIGADMDNIHSQLSSLAGQVGANAVPAATKTVKSVNGTSAAAITYTIPVYAEGTETYSATVELIDYTKTPTSDRNLNTKQFANMSAFNDTTTALINPSAVAGGFDSSVVDYFSTLHSVYFNGLDQDDIQEVNTHNNALWDEWRYDCIIADLEGRPQPAAPTYAPSSDPRNAFYLWNVPSARTKLTDEQMIGYITKDITLDLGYVETERLGYQYVLNSVTNYTLDNDAYSVRGSGGICNATDATMEMPCPGYCDNVYYSDLNNIYILYTPLGDYSGTNITLENETIKLTNSISVSAVKNAYFAETGETLADVEPLNLFVVVQAQDGQVLNTTNGLTIKCDGTGDRLIKVYSQVDFTISGGSSAYVKNGYDYDRTHNSDYVDLSDASQQYSLITASKMADRIYDATVTVMDSAGNVVATLNSALTTQ